MTRIPLFLDTSIQVDRAVGSRDLQAAASELLKGYSYLFACGFSRLEFKRTVIQNLGLLLDYLSEDEPPSFFGAMQKATRSGAHQPRRVGTLVNILAWTGFQVNASVEVEAGGDVDRRLGLQAQAMIRNAIRSLWIWYEKSVGSVADHMDCQRGKEGPVPTRGGGFDLTVRESRCKTKACRNANFFREHGGALRALMEGLQQLEAGGVELTAELKKASAAIKAALSNPDRLYDYRNCLALGDVWIHLESVAAGVKDFATKNYKESDVLCPRLGLNVRCPGRGKPPQQAK